MIVPPTAGRAIEELGAFLAGGALPLVEVVLPVTPYPELGVLTKSMLPPRPEGRGHSAPKSAFNEKSIFLFQQQSFEPIAHSVLKFCAKAGT